MDRQQFEQMQVERFRRAAARELEHERINRMRRRVWGAALVVVLSGAGVVGCLARTKTQPVVVVLPQPPTDEAPPEVWATDGEAPDAGPVARPLPAKPFEGQKRPDPKTLKCDADEVLLVGACWVEVVRPPRTDNCGPKFFEHDGKCYLPVQQARRLPTSVMP